MKWLQSVDDNKYEVSYAISKGCKVMLKRKSNDNETEKIMIKRMKQRYQQKDSRVRRQMQANIKELMNKHPSREDTRKIYDQAKDDQLKTFLQFMMETEKIQRKPYQLLMV